MRMLACASRGQGTAAAAPTPAHNPVLAGAGGGLGDATLHNVYAESIATGEITAAVRKGTLGDVADDDAASGPDAASAEEQEEAVGQQAALEQQLQHEEAEGEHDEDLHVAQHLQLGALLSDPLPGAMDTQLDSPAAGGQDALEGMTMHLLQEEPDGNWLAAAATEPHAAAAAPTPQARMSVGLTGRGSVGSNMNTGILVGG